MEKILIGNKISKSYGKKSVLSEVDINVYKGEVYGLLGKNGEGKTTLLKIISNCIPKSKYSGNLELNTSKSIGSVIDTPACFLDLSVLENLKLYNLIESDKTTNKMKEVIEKFDLTDFLNKKAKDLSLGMLQRVRLALAFISDADLIVLDEPFNGLDLETVLSLREEITRFSKTDKKTIIITSHDTEQLEKLCDRYGILNKGKLIEFSKEEQVENGSLETVYIKILRGEQSWQ